VASADHAESAASPLVRAATPADVPVLLEMFGELAEYEHLEHLLQATERRLGDALFGEHPAAAALLAESGAEVAGNAVFFPTFSSFLAIEDLERLAGEAAAGPSAERR
jgi:hypothetical protein